MTLGSVEGRVLACLIEKETTVADSYPLTMKALLSACNQSSNRNPQTDYDELTVAEALDALKVDGLVRFVHPSHGGRTLRYRHVVEERWQLGVGELGVLAMLILRGPETEATLRARAERHLAEGGLAIEDALAALTGGAEPFVRLLDRRPGEREARYSALLVESHPTAAASSAPEVEVTSTSDATNATTRAKPSSEAAVGPDALAAADLAASNETTQMVEALLDEVTDLRRRVERLERLFDG
ncbi:MAG: DUF480 domain-containing protein [Ilumatobacter sp.]